MEYSKKKVITKKEERVNIDHLIEEYETMFAKLDKAEKILNIRYKAKEKQYLCLRD